MATEHEQSTPLFSSLKRRIRLEGAITVADYMAEVIATPKEGYYMAKDPFGRRGDFITAPEISQMFGELLGLWAVDTWQNMGQPGRFTILELGPGRGTLMADALRAARLCPPFLEACKLHLLEISPVLRKEQAKVLQPFQPKWHESLETITKDCPLIAFANEFFDALPIHQFERCPQGWCERLVTLNPEESALCFTLSPPLPFVENLLPASVKAKSEEGAVFEYAPAAKAVLDSLLPIIEQQRGALLLIDYGWAEQPLTPSLQAIKNHQYHPVLTDAGRADLSALVDFSALKNHNTSRNIVVHGPLEQGPFLQALGIEERARHLISANPHPKVRATVQQALNRLTDEEGMGSLFKVMAFRSSAQADLAGLPLVSR